MFDLNDYTWWRRIGYAKEPRLMTVCVHEDELIILGHLVVLARFAHTGWEDYKTHDAEALAQTYDATLKKMSNEIRRL